MTTATKRREQQDERVCISTKLRAEIIGRDWDAVMIAADRRKPFGSVFGGKR